MYDNIRSDLKAREGLRGAQDCRGQAPKPPSIDRAPTGDDSS